jgi:hypothetical protein
MSKMSNNRRVLLLIGGIPVAVVLLSTWLWYVVARGDLDLVGFLGTANRGTLIQPPRRIDKYVFHDATGQQVRYASLPPRWTMVIPGRGARCGKACERNLYETRQIRIAMGKDFDRLRRWYVSEHSPRDTRLAVRSLSDGQPAPGSFVEYLEQEHGRLQALTLFPAAYDALFREHGIDESTWYLVDPAGWVMMSYNKTVSYKDVITDLKFLLKNSSG